MSRFGFDFDESDYDEDCRESRRPTYRCGGYGSYTGHCGALDCETCYPGNRYHDFENLSECKCGASDYDDLENPRCRKCNTGPEVISKIKRSIHTAKRNHKDGRVKIGDRYKVSLTMGYYPNGPRFMRTSKTILKSA